MDCSQIMQIPLSGVLCSRILEEFNGFSIVLNSLFSPVALVAEVTECEIEQCKRHRVRLDGMGINDFLQLLFSRCRYIILASFVVIAAAPIISLISKIMQRGRTGLILTRLYHSGDRLAGLNFPAQFYARSVSG